MAAPNTSSLDDPHQRWHLKQSNLFHCFLNTMKRLLKTYLQSFNAIHGVRLALAVLRSSFFYVFQASESSVEKCWSFLTRNASHLKIHHKTAGFSTLHINTHHWFKAQIPCTISSFVPKHYGLEVSRRLRRRGGCTSTEDEHRTAQSHRAKHLGSPHLQKVSGPKFSLPNKTRKLVPGPILFCWTYLKW